MKDLLLYLAFRAGMAVLGVLPGGAARWLGEWGGGLAFRLAKGRRRMASRHAARALEAGEDADAGARRMFVAYGRYWAEAFWMRPRRVGVMEAKISVDGIEHVRAAKAAGNGQIFALPHIGNWEFAGPVGVQEGLVVVAVAENLANARIRDWFVRLRAALGIEIVIAGGGAGVLRRLTEALDQNAGVALVCDRDLSGRGVPVRFFGEETTLPGGPVALARRSGAPILPVACYFRPDGGHHLVIRPPVPLTPGGDVLRESTQRLADELEALIRAAPDQWHLLQPNWPSDRAAGDR